MVYIKDYMIASSKKHCNINIDFVWSTEKGKTSLYPLYRMALLRGWISNFYKVKKQSIFNRKLVKSLSSIIIIAYDQPLYRLYKSGWKGKYIYIEHGLGAIKYYTYKYDFFHKAEILFYPGPVFQRKMEAINPNFNNGLLGGYPKIDYLINSKINKQKMINDLSLNSNKPIILFAPSWGGKYSKNSGIWNAEYLKNIDNLIIIPHSQDYKYAKKLDAIIPQNKIGISPYLLLSDVVISDVSSVIAESAIINTPVVQLRLPLYHGCFPDKDKRQENIWISKKLIYNEEINANLHTRPFKIAYLNEDWIMGITSDLSNIKENIIKALTDSNKFKKMRKYWAEQSCYMADGKTSIRIAMMIEHFVLTGQRQQIGDIN